MKDEPRKKLASADTLPAPVQAANTPRELDPAKARFTVSDTMPIAEVPEPQLPASVPGERHSVMPSGLHERGKLGRFDILDILGQGGMGVVVAAYDPQLDRKVAIKVLRTRGLTGRRREKEAARLLREARTMAQLSHPHVVTVYEAGELDDRVYIAMEYIPGQTLRAWLDEQPRTVGEVVDAYIKAGRGLAAGHAAGLIHRDFKPDNVLVGFDGRVRVIDFGLARPTRGQDTPSPHDDSGEVTEPDPMAASGIHLQLTTAGSLFGTPIYMSPEQHQKLRLDGKSDQFSFCVALYEALFQDLPFPSGSYAELAFNVSKGNVKTPPERADIPKRVVDAIMRGLLPNPDDRFPTMDALLEALEPPAKQLGKKLVFALAGIAAVAVGLVVVLLVRGESAPDRGPPCLDGPQRLAGVWDDGVKARLKTAFDKSGRTHADETYRRVVDALDAYTAAWIADRKSVCEATEVHREQSPEAFDLRMKCLGERRDELASLTQLFATADAATTDNAISAARSLSPTAACVKLVPNVVAPPTAAQSTKLEPILKERADLRAHMLATKYAVVEALGAKLVVRAKEVDYGPVTGDLMLTLAVAQLGLGKYREAERTIREAMKIAARSKDDKLVAQLWAYLIWAVGSDTARYKEALDMIPAAELAIERAEAWKVIGGDFHFNVGNVHFAKSEYTLAIKSWEVARDFRLEQFGEKDTDTSKLYTNLGGAYLRDRNVAAARESFKKAAELAEKTMGPNHPDTALALTSLAALAQAMGNWDEASRLNTRALAVLAEVRGPNDISIGVIEYSLGISFNGKEDFKSALPHYQRALAIFENISPTHPQVGLALIGVADCLEELGDPKQAVGYGERALVLVASSPDPVQVAMSQFILAKALWGAGIDKPRARKLAEQAREGFRAGGFGALMGTAAVEKWFAKIDGKK